MIGWIPKGGIASAKIMNILKILILVKLHSRKVSIHFLTTVQENAFLSLLLSALISRIWNFFF